MEGVGKMCVFQRKTNHNLENGDEKMTIAVLDEIEIIDLGWPWRSLTTSTVVYRSDSWVSCSFIAPALHANPCDEILLFCKFVASRFHAACFILSCLIYCTCARTQMQVITTEIRLKMQILVFRFHGGGRREHCKMTSVKNVQRRCMHGCCSN